MQYFALSKTESLVKVVNFEANVVNVENITWRSLHILHIFVLHG